MTKRIFIAVSLLVILCGLTPAQQTTAHTKDEAAIRLSEYQDRAAAERQPLRLIYRITNNRACQ